MKSDQTVKTGTEEMTSKQRINDTSELKEEIKLGSRDFYQNLQIYNC